MEPRTKFFTMYVKILPWSIWYFICSNIFVYKYMVHFDCFLIVISFKEVDEFFEHERIILKLCIA